MSPVVARAYAQHWRQKKVTHELTISPADHAASFSRADLDETLKRLIRTSTHQMRNFPKRKLGMLKANHPDALFITGFHEDRRRGGDPFEHWHGGVSLRPGEEMAFRAILREHIGREAGVALQPQDLSGTSRPISPNKLVPLSFHFAPLKTAATYIAYANKHAVNSDFDTSTTYSFLPYDQQILH